MAPGMESVVLRPSAPAGRAAPLPEVASVPVPSCSLELQALARQPDATARTNNPNRRFSIWGMCLSPVEIAVGLARRETDGSREDSASGANRSRKRWDMVVIELSSLPQDSNVAEWTSFSILAAQSPPSAWV